MYYPRTCFMKLLFVIKQKTATKGFHLNSGRGILMIKRSYVKRLSFLLGVYSSSVLGISVSAFNASDNASAASSAETEISCSVNSAALRAARFS